MVSGDSIRFFLREIYGSLSSLVEENVSELGELGFVLQLLRGLSLDMWCFEDGDVFVIYSLVALILVYLGVRGGRMEYVLDKLEECEERFMSPDGSVFWSMFLLNLAEADILWGGKRVDRAKSIFEKLRNYPNLEFEERALLDAKIALFRMMISVAESRDDWRNLITRVKRGVEECSSEALIILISELGDCLRMGGLNELGELYREFFEFLRNFFYDRGLMMDLRWLYRTLSDMLFLGRDSHSPRELQNFVLEVLRGAIFFKRERFEWESDESFILIDSLYNFLRFSAEAGEPYRRSILKVSSYVLGEEDDIARTIDEVIVSMWEYCDRKPELEPLSNLFENLARLLINKYERRNLKHVETIENIYLFLIELIRNMDFTGNIEALEELEEEIWKLPLSPEKILLLTTAIYTYTLNGKSNYEHKFLKILEITRELLESKIGKLPKSPKGNYLRTVMMGGFFETIHLLGRIIAVTKDPKLVTPTINVCYPSKDSPDYFALRTLLEGIVWQLRTMKHGIEFTICTQYN